MQSYLSSCSPYFAQEVQTSYVMSCHWDSCIVHSLIWSKFPTTNLTHPQTLPQTLCCTSWSSRSEKFIIFLTYFWKVSVSFWKVLVLKPGLCFELTAFHMTISSRDFPPLILGYYRTCRRSSCPLYFLLPCPFFLLSYNLSPWEKCSQVAPPLLVSTLVTSLLILPLHSWVVLAPVSLSFHCYLSQILDDLSFQL